MEAESKLVSSACAALGVGHMQPPAGGATFLDPMMRNSREFPKWLNAPETKEKLKGRGLHSSTSRLNLSRFGLTSPCPPV